LPGRPGRRTALHALRVAPAANLRARVGERVTPDGREGRPCVRDDRIGREVADEAFPSSVSVSSIWRPGMGPALYTGVPLDSA
jgi:hypothetical protein